MQQGEAWRRSPLFLMGFPGSVLPAATQGTDETAGWGCAEQGSPASGSEGSDHLRPPGGSNRLETSFLS